MNLNEQAKMIRIDKSVQAVLGGMTAGKDGRQ
jgi:hypothetical protein